MDKKALRIGINLGGWISQYPAFDHRHFESFITSADIRRIADWGYDHVRLPVDYPVIEDAQRAGSHVEKGFGYIESCIEWCRECGLKVILDLHKTPGFAFDDLKRSTLFQSPELQDRFLELWTAITRRFAGRMMDELAFELLNEIVLPDTSPWNELAARTVGAVRSLDPGRLIVVGGNYYNAADELGNLALPDDPNILYTFHFYLPLAVTHQKAPWIPALASYNREVPYPGGQAGGLAGHIGDDTTHRLDRETQARFDRRYLEGVLLPAIEFSRQSGRPVYCGEFGVYERAPLSTRLSWTSDVIDLFNRNGIGRALWTYKDLDFGLVDKDGAVVSPELVEVAARGK